MPIAMSVESIKQTIGRSLEPGDWFVVEQPRIQRFADSTEDYQFIHIDYQRAKQTELGGTIAHGFLTLSLLPKLTEHSLLVPEGTVMGINYGFDKIRFLNPVRPGDEIRAQVTVINVQEKGEGRILFTLQISVDIKGQDKPALVCEWLNLFVFERQVGQ